MKIQLLIILSTLLMASFAFGRAPAVDPVVGIEPATYVDMKKGQQFAYDFRGDPAVITRKTPVPGNVFTLLALMGFVALPFLVYMGVTMQTKNETAKAELATNNVRHVDFTQKDSTGSDNDKDQIDKAS